LTAAIRIAEPDDADAVARLLVELGYRVTPARVEKSLAAMQNDYDPVFVATSRGTVVGIVALNVTRWIQLEKPIARIPAMIVEDAHQRRGIGRRLVEHAVNHARALGCGTIELTSANDRADAHAFYREVGFEQTSVRFKRSL
jgi:GNAT superfamily N-acetyltransferase